VGEDAGSSSAIVSDGQAGRREDAPGKGDGRLSLCSGGDRRALSHAHTRWARPPSPSRSARFVLDPLTLRHWYLKPTFPGLIWAFECGVRQCSSEAKPRAKRMRRKWPVAAEADQGAVAGARNQLSVCGRSGQARSLSGGDPPPVKPFARSPKSSLHGRTRPPELARTRPRSLASLCRPPAR
jgi:hypothetical protein